MAGTDLCHSQNKIGASMLCFLNNGGHMKKWIAVLFASVCLASINAHAEEFRTEAEMPADAVIEPMLRGCPSGTRPVAKYCWNEYRGCFVKCGVLCQKVPTPPPTGGTPDPE